MATTISITLGTGDSTFALNTGSFAAGGVSQWNDLTGTVDVITFTTTNGGPQEVGELAWDQAEETLSLGLPHGTILQIGEETLYHVENFTGSTIPDGTPVSYAGTVGSSGKIRVKPWNGSTDSPLIFMGIATSEILHEGAGYVTHFGKVRGINTSAFSANSILYANPSGTGLTATQPTSGKYVIAALVINSANNGTLFVRPSRDFATSTGGNGSADAGKVVVYGSTGEVKATKVDIESAGGATGLSLTPPASSFAVPVFVAGSYQVAATQSATGVPDNLSPPLSKTTLVDADFAFIGDSAASFVAKSVTLTNFWSWIKGKIDAITSYAIASNATFSYGNSTARDNHLTALGGSTVGQAVFKAADAAAARTAMKVPASDATGVSGADEITNIISLTQAEYDAIGSPSATTLYVIV